MSCFSATLTPSSRRAVMPSPGRTRKQSQAARSIPAGQAIARIAEVGRKAWKQESGYHRRSLAETAMSRYKTIFGPQLYSRTFQNQQQENTMKIKALNTMTALGMPRSIAII
jgi:hypothetical protein